MKATILYDCPNSTIKVVLGVFTSTKMLLDTARNIVESRVTQALAIDQQENLKQEVDSYLEKLVLEHRTQYLPIGDLEIEVFTINQTIADE